MRYLLYLIFLLLPWYLLDSGGFQLVDLPILLFSCLYFFRKKIYTTPLLELLWLFFAYSFAITFILHFVAKTPTTLLSMNAYHLILCTVFCGYLLKLRELASPEQIYHSLMICLQLTLLIPLAYLFFDTDQIRLALSFNNPNQLAYFAILNLSILYYTFLYAEDYKIPQQWIPSLFIFVGNTSFVLLSLGRSGMVSYLILLLGFVAFLAKRIHAKKILFYLLTTLVICLIAVVFYKSAGFIRGGLINNHEKHRFFHEMDLRLFSGLEYNFSNLWVFLFGTGSTLLHSNDVESHNNFIEIFNQTGIIGLGLYLSFVYSMCLKIWRSGRFAHAIPFLAYLTYGLFQYGIRFRYSTIALAFFIFFECVCLSQKKSMR